MAKSSKTRASRLKYVSTSHVLIPGFETPFDQNLDPTNRWVIMAKNIPWDKLVRIYDSKIGKSNFGASKINSRIAIGSLIIKYLNDLSDRDVVGQLQENVYMQYFVGLSSFCSTPLYDPSLLVEFRNRLGMEELKEINEIIVSHWAKANELKKNESDKREERTNDADQFDDKDKGDPTPTVEQSDEVEQETKGSLIIDATAVPQDIAYPTDLNLLSEAREILEGIIDQMYEKSEDKQKPRTYREIARKVYLTVAQNRNPSRKTIRAAIKKQLQFVGRNLRIVNRYMDELGIAGVLTSKQYNYFLRITALYDQQLEMYKQKKQSVDNRIVSLHQPHVRPIVRGKRNAKVEFGAKIQIGLVGGISYLDYLSWDAYNEGQYLEHSVEEYKRRTGYYPSELLADKIYCTRANRAFLKEKNIKLKAKPLGRPTALQNHVSPGERNPIEGKFGQAKTAYGLQRVKARLSNTSASWIAGIILVLNLVKLAGQSAYCLISKWITLQYYYAIRFNFNISFQSFATN